MPHHPPCAAHLWPTVLLLAITSAAPAAAAEPACPILDQPPSGESLPVSLPAAPAQLFGVHDGTLFAFGASAGCAGCEVTAAGGFYDPCTNAWQIERLPLGVGFRIDDHSIHHVGDRVVGLTLAVRRDPALSPASDYTLLGSETRGVVLDLRRRKLSVIRRHEREWRSGQDVIDGFAERSGRYVIYIQKPRGSGARVFVYDVERMRWAGSFNAPPELGRLVVTHGPDLWFELHPRGPAARHLVFDTARGSTRMAGSAPPAPGTTAALSPLEMRNHRGMWSGAIRMALERSGRSYELRVGVLRVARPNGCENVRRRPCDPVVRPPVTRLQASLHHLTQTPQSEQLER